MPIETVDAAGSRRGAELLLDVLRSEGVRYIFGNPGTTELPLIDALTEAQDIGYILALQEATVVAMADGYAQGARRPAFLNLHTAGGLGHGMGALWNAQVSGTPLVVTAGQQDLRHALSDPLLMGDLVAIADPVMKWARSAGPRLGDRRLLSGPRFQPRDPGALVPARGRRARDLCLAATLEVRSRLHGHGTGQSRLRAAPARGPMTGPDRPLS